MAHGDFGTRHLKTAERLAAADELFGRGLLPMRLLNRAGDTFEASVRHVDLAPLTVVKFSATPAAVLRTPRLIRRGDPEMLSLIVPVDAGLTVGQAGRETVVRADELALYDSSQPFRIQVTAESAVPGVTTVVSLHAPRALLGLPPGGLDPLLARPLPAGRGALFGRTLHQILSDVIEDGTGHRPVDLARLGHVALDLVTALVAHHLEAEALVPESVHHRTLLLRVDSFIRQRLHDVTLSPATVAAAHHISVSHLHRLFEPRRTTVAASIRRQRLERARRDLADPALRDMPVHRIADRWGFRGHPTFTRAFRAAFGTSPQDYRNSALAATADERR
ncbi:helix-turn-helix domain-containing protein [Streptomyces murinus]|uniref:helix-turn-helix domain-containing protein n=2 Tax=Streptomyces TaxID=1883 RepID=UPI0013025507|nr:helix-turn-helix domain-containing protein [Streptomyces murinus]